MGRAHYKSLQEVSPPVLSQRPLARLRPTFKNTFCLSSSSLFFHRAPFFILIRFFSFHPFIFLKEFSLSLFLSFSLLSFLGKGKVVPQKKNPHTCRRQRRAAITKGLALCFSENSMKEYHWNFFPAKILPPANTNELTRKTRKNITRYDCGPLRGV